MVMTSPFALIMSVLLFCISVVTSADTSIVSSKKVLFDQQQKQRKMSAMNSEKDSHRLDDDPCRAYAYNKSACANAPISCQWCAQIANWQSPCVSTTNGTCCSAGLAACSVNAEREWCNPNSQICDVESLNPYNDTACNVAQCCPNEKPDLCASNAGIVLMQTCYNKKEQKCCTNNGALCSTSQSCCGSKGSYHSNVCCDTKTQMCRETSEGNICVDKNATGTCSALFSQNTCLKVVNASTGKLACQWCHGQCMDKSAGKCCSNSGGDACDDITYSNICQKGDICVKNSHWGGPAGVGCTAASCCPKEYAAVCLTVFGAYECYNPTTHQCCLESGNTGLVKPLSSGACCTYSSQGNKTCPDGGTCCGDFPVTCCSKGQVCTMYRGVIPMCEAGKKP